ncbi:MAG: NmrA family NAD(P)-binding protein [Rhodobacterales bacterium]
MTHPKILAVGAAGKFAGAVIPELARRGAWVRGLVKQDADKEGVVAAGASEAVTGDLRDIESLRVALTGMDSVFYIAPAFFPDEAEVGKAVVAAAMKAGISRFVFSSVIHPVLGLPNHAAKAPVEAAVLNSDMEYSFLHPTLFFQNYASTWSKVSHNGVLAAPWSSETRFSRVDYRDVAETAAIALTEDRLLFGTFELCADGWLNRHDVAALMARVMSRPVRAERTDPGSLGPEAAPMRPMFEHYDHAGLLGNPLTLRAVLGREPRGLLAYFNELESSSIEET